VNRALRDSIVAVVAGVSLPLVLVGAAVLLFLNPIWVSFEQGRSQVTAWTGYTAEQVNQVTGSILSDLVFGPPRFDAAVNGVQVLDSREVSHMADVRGVFMALGAVGLLALIALVATAAGSRLNRSFWRGVEIGATVLAGGVVVVGIFLAVFFDQVFLLFHDVFFAPGSFSFDPRTEKLVQLFPDQFWSDTSIALAAVVLALGLASRWLAHRMIAAPRPAPAVAAEVAP
jgi:integral membrane protein (TIGR01906 family)